MLFRGFDRRGDFVGEVASVILTGERGPDVLQGQAVERDAETRIAAAVVRPTHQVIQLGIVELDSWQCEIVFEPCERQQADQDFVFKWRRKNHQH